MPSSSSLDHYGSDSYNGSDPSSRRKTKRQLSESRRATPISKEEEERRRERRKERRRIRAEQDPEGEGRRQERRQERRQQRRQDRATSDLDTRRRERRASRRAESDSTLPKKPEQCRIAITDSESSSEPPQSRPPPRADSWQSSEDARQLPRTESWQSPADTKKPPRSDSWHSSDDGWNDDLEKLSIDEKYPDSRYTSSYDELQWYKRGTIPSRQYSSRDEEERSCCAGRRKCIIISSLVAFLTLFIIITVAIVVSKNKFHYTPSTAQVNSTAAFLSGGATHNSINDTKDGIGAGSDVYIYYQGHAAQFPNASRWTSFEDMWNINLATLQQSCGLLGYGYDDSETEIQDIYDAIQDRANSSLVDHRLILALVLQESHGCVRVPHTTSSGGVRNTGLMQAHNGEEFNAHHSGVSIMAMIQDGTQGTRKGDGLVQLLNTYGNPYEAARGYNSGYIPSSGDLSEAAGATACYVSDIANRLTGWVQAISSCPGS